MKRASTLKRRERQSERVREELRRNTTQKGRITRGSNDVKRADGYSEKGHEGMKDEGRRIVRRKREREREGGGRERALFIMRYYIINPQFRN